MASNSSKSLPFLVLAILITSLFAESYFEIVLANDNYVIILGDLSVEIRVQNVKGEVIDSASGRCRMLDQ